MHTSTNANTNIHVTKQKARAKDLLKAVRANHESALLEIKPYFDDPTDFKLSQAQLVIARRSGCESWKQLTLKRDWLACSFCKKLQYEVSKLIAGPDVYVCDECVDKCNDILREDAALHR